MSDAWINGVTGIPKHFNDAFRRAVWDRELGLIRARILEGGGHSIVYKHLLCPQGKFKHPWYLDNLDSDLIAYMSRFRLRSSNLGVVKQAWTGVDLADRLCEYCRSANIDDEYHFLFVCSYTRELRGRYIPAQYVTQNNVQSMVDLLNIENKQILSKVHIY